MHRSEQRIVQRQIEDVGRCVLNRETQIDQCSVRVTHSDGSILAGTLKNKYTLDADHTLTMSVTPEMISLDFSFQQRPLSSLSGALPR